MFSAVFLGVLLFCFFLLAVTKPFLSSRLIVFFLPAYLWRYQLFGLSTNFLECLLLVALFVFFSRFLLKKGWQEFILPFYANKLLIIGVGMLLFGIFLSLAFSTDKMTGLGIIKSWFFLPLLFFLVLQFQIKNSRSLFLILKSLVFSGTAVSFVAMFCLFLGNLTYDGRLRAFFEHPNHLAMFLAPAWLIAFSFWLNEKKQIDKKFWLSFLLLISFPLYFSFSYGAWLGLMGAGIIIIFGLSTNRHAKIKTKFPVLIFIALLIISVLILGQLNLPKFKNMFVSQRSSLSSRIIIWQSALRILKDHWLIGIGPGMFQNYYLDYQKYFPPYLEWAVPQPHNLFLAFWLQAGLSGLIGFSLILVWFFKKSLLQTKNKKIALLLAAIMAYFLIHGLIDTPYWKNDLSVLFWLILALKLSLGKISLSRAVKFN